MLTIKRLRFGSDRLVENGRRLEENLFCADDLPKEERRTTIGELVKEGVLSVSTGVEVGKMTYGTGTIPFLEHQRLRIGK